jgi:hypothetical protein
MVGIVSYRIAVPYARAMTAGTRRVMAIVGGVVFGVALGMVAPTFVPIADGNSTAAGGLGIGLGVGLLVAALVRD